MTASDLSEFAFETINSLELAAALLPPNVNIAVHYDQSEADRQITPVSNPALCANTVSDGGCRWGTSGRAIIQPDTDPDNIATTFELLGESHEDSGDGETLRSFISWAIGTARADHYGLVMWNHGAGIQGFNFDNRGDENGDKMRIGEMVQALTAVNLGTASGKFDLVAFDACLMSMAEVGYALSPFATTIVASQDVEVATGYYYPDALSILARRPDLVTGNDLASHLVVSFQDRYQGNAHGADTHAAADGGQYAELASRIESFTSAVQDHALSQDWLMVRQARAAAASFQNHPEYRDLGQFFQGLTKVANGECTSRDGLNAAIGQSACGFLQSLDELIVAKTTDVRRTSGLSIYFPKPGDEISAEYDTNHHGAFFAATGWDHFLQSFVAETSLDYSLSLDWAESNETAAKAYNLHRLAGHGHEFDALSIHQENDQDWFRFFIQQAGTASDNVTVSVSGSSTQSLMVQICDSEQQSCQTAVALPNENAVLNLAGKPQGQYLVRIQGDGTSVVPGYKFTVNAPGSAAVEEDPVRGNDQRSKAHRLGSVGAETVFSGLVAAPSQEDWFEFQTPKNQRFDLALNSPPESWNVLVKFTGSQPVTARIEPVSEGSGFEPVQLSGDGLLKLPYRSGAGLLYRLMIRTDSETAVAYTLQMAPLEIQQATVAHFAGTSGRDEFSITVGEHFFVVVNGTSHTLDRQIVTKSLWTEWMVTIRSAFLVVQVTKPHGCVSTRWNSRVWGINSSHKALRRLRCCLEVGATNLHFCMTHLGVIRFGVVPISVN